MKKIQSVIYPFWIILSFLISIFLMIKLYPNYINNEFPLFTDLTLLLFLPAFFIFSYTLIRDIFTIDPDEIKDIKVLKTMIDGEFVYER